MSHQIHNSNRIKLSPEEDEERAPSNREPPPSKPTSVTATEKVKKTRNVEPTPTLPTRWIRPANRRKEISAKDNQATVENGDESLDWTAAERKEKRWCGGRMSLVAPPKETTTSHKNDFDLWERKEKKEGRFMKASERLDRFKTREVQVTIKMYLSLQ